VRALRGKLVAAWRVVIEEKGRLVNWPNFLSILRIISVPSICSYIQQQMIFWAAWLFVYAAITDLFDGIIARRYNQETIVGKFLDQAADKCLVVPVIYYLGKADFIDLWPWIVTIIIWREIIIGLGRLLILDTKIGEIISTNRLGQIKATAQYIGIPFTLFNWPAFNYIMAVVAILTLISGVVYILSFIRWASKEYFKRLKDLLRNNKKR